MGTITQLQQGAYSCKLAMDLNMINIRENLYKDHNPFKIDYLMMSLDGIIWKPFQEVSVKLDLIPQIERVSIQAMSQSETNLPFSIEGTNMHPDLEYTLNDFPLHCSYQNATLGKQLTCLTLNNSQMENLLKQKTLQTLTFGFNSIVKELNISKVFYTSKNIQVLSHQRFTPTDQQLNITTDKEYLATFVSQDIIYTEYESKILCRVSGNLHYNDIFYINASISNKYVSCKLQFKVLNIPQQWNVSLIYRDNFLLSTQPLVVNVLPLMPSFTLQPELVICDNYKSQNINVTFSQKVDYSIIRSNQTYLGTNLTKSQLQFKTSTFAQASLLFTCKKNITKYDLTILSQNDDTMISYNQSIVAIKRFKIVEISQSKVNQGLALKIDREIEFALLLRSFNVSLYIDSIETSQVYVDVASNGREIDGNMQFSHTFYCKSLNISNLQNTQLQLYVELSNNQKLEIAEYIPTTVKFFNEKQIKVVLQQIYYMMQLDYQIILKIATDQQTMQRLHNIDIACRIYNKEYTVYLDAQLENDIVICPFTSQDLGVFTGAFNELQNNCTLSVSLQLEDFQTIQMQNNQTSITLIKPPNLIQISPNILFKDVREGQQSILIQYESQFSFHLQKTYYRCLLTEPKSLNKYLTNLTYVNQTYLACYLPSNKDRLSKPGSYRITLASNKYNYMNDSLSLEIYPTVNVSQIIPSQIFLGASQLQYFKILGEYRSLYWYYQKYNDLDRFKIEISGDMKGIQFPITNIDYDSIHVQIQKLETIQFKTLPINATISIKDTYTNGTIAVSSRSIQIRNSLLIKKIYPQRSFAQFDTLNISIELTSQDKIQMTPTYCIQNAANVQLNFRINYEQKELAICQLTQNVSQNISLGYYSEEDKQIIPMTNSILFEVPEIIKVSHISPISATIIGGTTVFVYGSGFLSIITYNQAFQCEFGSILVQAKQINDFTMTCTTPQFAIAKEVDFQVLVEDTQETYFKSQNFRFFVEDIIQITQVIPNIIDQSIPTALLRLEFLKPVEHLYGQRYQCQLSRKNSQTIEQISNCLLMQNGQGCLCEIVTSSLNSLVEYEVKIYQQTVQMEQYYPSLRVYPKMKIVQQKQQLQNLIIGRGQNITFEIQGIQNSYLKNRFQCKLCLNQNEDYYYEAQMISQNSYQCSIFIPFSIEQDRQYFTGKLYFYNSAFDIGSVNYLNVTLFKYDLTVLDVYPQSNNIFHPGISINFKVFVSYINSQSDLPLSYCIFGNEYQNIWFTSQAYFIDVNIIGCDLKVPNKTNVKRIQEIYISIDYQDNGKSAQQEKFIISLTQQSFKENKNKNESSINQTEIILEEIQPTFGPYQGGIYVYLRLSGLQDISLEQAQNLYCNFDKLEDTQLEIINMTYGRCQFLSSKYQQNVDVKLKSQDSMITISQLMKFHFSFEAMFEFHQISPHFIIKEQQHQTSIVTITGKNFNSSRSYYVTLISQDTIRNFTINCSYIDDRKLAFDYSLLPENINRRFRIYLHIQGNEQVTQNIQQELSIVYYPKIQLQKQLPYIQRDFTGVNVVSFVNISGKNTYSEGIETKCAFIMGDMNKNKTVISKTNVLENKSYKSHSEQVIQCQVPMNQIVNSKIREKIWVTLIYEDSVMLNQKLQLNVSIEQKAYITQSIILAGISQNITIYGNYFSPLATYVCFITDSYQSVYEVAAIINSTTLSCPIRPLSNIDGQSIQVEVIVQNTGEVIGAKALTVRYDEIIHLSQVSPQIIYQNQTNTYLLIIGENIQSDCQCVFGQVISQDSIFMSSSQIKCHVPSLQMKDRYKDQRALLGFFVDLSLICPLSFKRSKESLSIFVKYGTIITNISRTYIRQNQFDQDPYIYLVGYHFNQQQLCVFEANGTIIESQFSQFINDEVVKCKIVGQFFDDVKYQSVSIYIKEYETQNNSIIYTSNKMSLTYLSQFTITANFDVSKEIFYLKDPGDIVLLSTNIYQLANFSYKCIYGANNDYISEPIFKNNKIVGCILPNIIDLISTIPLKLVELTSDNKVSFSNQISIQLINFPFITNVNPLQVPAYENEPRQVTIKGENFIHDNTYLYMGDFKVMKLNVQSSTTAILDIAKNMTPGVYSLRVTTSYFKQPQKKLSSIGLEYIKLPEIKRLIPEIVPSIQVKQKVMVQGQNFTSKTQCMVDGKTSITTYITSNLLECEIDAALAGQEKSLMLLQNNMYFNRETNFKVKYFASAYVYDIQPRIATRTQQGTRVEILVANMPVISNNDLSVQYCKFGNYVTVVDEIEFEEEQDKRTNFTKFICRTPFVPNAGQVNVEVLTEQGIFTSSLSNTFTFIDPPYLTSSSPSIMPTNISDTLITLTGKNFDSSYKYYCQFKTHYTFQNDTLGTFISNTQLTCSLPSQNFKSEGGYLNVRVVVKNQQEQVLFLVEGITRILIYEPPAIEKITPYLGRIDGGNDVFIQGRNFDISLGGIFCKFGTQKVPATVVQINRLIRCVAPQSQITNTNTVEVTVSTDDVYYYQGVQQTSIYYTYYAPPTITSFVPIKQSVWGEIPLLITGSGFLYPSKVTCRFQFSTSSSIVDIAGIVKSTNEIICTSPKHLGTDLQIAISISFNAVDFYPVTTLTSYYQQAQKARVYSISPACGQANQLKYNTTLTITGSDLLSKTYASFGNFSNNNGLNVLSSTTAEVVIPQYANISIYDNTSTYGDNRASVEVGDSTVGFSRDEIVYTYIDSFKITSMTPLLVSPLGQEIIFYGQGFINTPSLNCKFGNHLAVQVKYYNRTKISCTTPLITDQSIPYPISISLNGIEYIDFINTKTNTTWNLTFTTPIYVKQIDPQIAFDDSQNIQITIQADTLVDLPTLSCKIHDYITTGTFILYNNLTYVSCIIPSFQYLQFTATTPIMNSTVIIEVSNNGIDFSQSGMTFKFIIVDQIVGIYPTTGPEEGGTLLNINLRDLPFSGDPTQVTLAQCKFPGYEPQKATYINSTLIQCITPPLIDNIDNITSNPAYAIAKVDVNLIGLSNQHFFFVYSKGFMVQRFEPPDAYILPDTNNQLAVNVIGVNFLPIYGSLFCKLYLPSEVRIVEATYVNNHTITCDVPSLSSSTQYPYPLRIEVSQNGGIQYSNNFKSFIYRMKDVISSLEPKLGYVQGNTYLQVGYSYFYDTQSQRAVCRFSLPDLSKSIETRIISYSSTHVFCYTPPAYLLSQQLYQDGGLVRLYISSNNRDFSDSYQEYTYMPTIQISTVDPLWIVNSDIVTITITGMNFFATPLLRVLLCSSVGDRKITISNVILRSSTQVELQYPNNVFINKDFVKVYITFDDNIYFESEDRIIVYEDITLIKAKPKYIYTDSTSGTIDVSIFGINFWNTEISEQLKCRIDGSSTTLAYFVNVEQVICSIPMQSTPKIVELEVTIDSVRYSINSVQVQFIPPPTITSLNVTSYYHTQDEIVYVKLQGTNLYYNRDNNGQIFIKVDDVVDSYQIDIGQIEIVFTMPKGLDIGIYSVYISTDGQNFLPMEPSPFLIEVIECPDAYFCSQFAASLCPQGYYCPETQMMPPIKCPSGTYSTGGLTKCQTCLDGEYCPRIGMASTLECPGGYICSGQNTISTNQLRICPEGYFCPAGTTTIDESNVGSIANVQPCPNGFWCPEGSKTSITDFGTFDSPQVCRDGQICGQSAKMESLTSVSGARDPFGVDICQLGQYCEAGIPRKCPKGAQCDYLGMIEPAKCEPGQYQNETGQTQCKLCPPGSFCLDEGMTMPFRCRPGYVCQFEGSPYPAQLCPAGSFCPISIVTNVTNSTVQKEYRPNYCFAASYCLQGVYTPIINSSNPQAAQQCQGGTFCQEGTKDPNGGGKCLEGYYCPPNSSDMLPTDPGFFSEGRGNEAQEPCRAGTYQDEPAQAACKECPIGYQCPNVQMVKPQKCPQGTYAQKTGQTQCDKCPQGTYSNKFGLTNQNECVDCEPKYFCGEAGLTSMFSATECQEGYQCGYRTTTNSMYNNQCPTGYYCDTGTSGMDDYFLCEPGFFCPAGTSKTKYNQNECLIGYYCPRGTAGDINANGSFKNDIYQLDKNPLIDAIYSYISRTQSYMTSFDIQAQNKELEAQKKQLAEVQTNKTKTTNATILENLSVLEEQYLSSIDDLGWLIEKYNNNQSYVRDKQTYLQTILSEVECSDNLDLPEELIALYSQNGKNLKCPQGLTTLAKSASCIGQCKKDINVNTPVSIIDPIKQAKDVSSLAEQDRFLQAEVESDFNDFNTNIREPLQEYTLYPLQIAKIYLDFTELPKGFKYNEHFAVIIINVENNQVMDMPYYFSSENNQITNKNALLQIRLFNWEVDPIQFQVGIYLYHGLFQPYLIHLKNKVTIEFYHAHRQEMFTNLTWGVLIAQAQLKGITIPYNTPDPDGEPRFYLDMTSTAEGVNPIRKNLDKDVYDSTFWDSKQINAVLMPWLPFFSNCEGYDSRIVLYDLLEYNKQCKLPTYSDIQTVNPIPSTGFDPVADSCNIQLKCIFDEPLGSTISTSTRWYAIQDTTDLFYVTQYPIDVYRMRQTNGNPDNPQTAYISLIEDGSDELIPASFIPEAGKSGIPTMVEVNLFYYQKTKTEKKLSKITVNLRNYTDLNVSETGYYQLRVNYEALSYFNLINTFQFSVPIYILLFSLVSLVLVLALIMFWLVNLQFSKIKKPPSLRFKHMGRVLFRPPAIGTVLASIPAMITAGLLHYLQKQTWFDDIHNDWSYLGQQLSSDEVITFRRGRLGIGFIVIGFTFMVYGSHTIISKPSSEEEEEIINNMQAKREKEKLELSMEDEDSDGGGKNDEEEELGEEETTIIDALNWKRRHFFINIFFIALFMMIKLEFSYSEIYGKNILYFQVGFTFLDIILEQVITRIVMGEALLTTPILSSFVVMDFIMTMGADDFQSFIISYFIETGLVVVSRTYIGPLVENLEFQTQKIVIKLSQRYRFVEKVFKSILRRQLNIQMQLINLTEYHTNNEKGQKKLGILEKGEGMEHLLGSVQTYACNTQALFIIPFVLTYVILFANETKIPQGYQIRQSDLNYYLIFSVIIIVPQMIIDVFLLHILEILHGYKLYDYFTYCDYKFRHRQHKWVTHGKFDKSIIHSWRSLDNMSFSSQYYFIVSLTTWGVIFLCLGMTTMLRNDYNPFADPVLLAYISMVVGAAVILKPILNILSGYIKLWEISSIDHLKIDIAQVNRLDKDNNMKRLIRNIQTNPFRHKFMRNNREWIIHNIALILGGKNYMNQAGPELEFLQNIFQRAVNAESIDAKLKIEQDRIAQDLAMMPYNKKQEGIDGQDIIVSDDSISDLPVYNWEVPVQITLDHVQRLANMWLDYAKQNMRLKEMVSDIVLRKLRSKCQRCKSQFRLQVVQKVNFQEIVKKFRYQMVGLPFTKVRWRRFYARHQLFVTLCMECAYIDNLKAQTLKKKDNELFNLITENAMKNVGAHNLIVQRNIKKPHVRRVIKKWIQIAKSNLLHNVKKKAEAADDIIFEDEFQQDI